MAKDSTHSENHRSNHDFTKGKYIIYAFSLWLHFVDMDNKVGARVGTLSAPLGGADSIPVRKLVQVSAGIFDQHTLEDPEGYNSSSRRSRVEEIKAWQ